jgi:hypothetical protein
LRNSFEDLGVGEGDLNLSIALPTEDVTITQGLKETADMLKNWSMISGLVQS